MNYENVQKELFERKLRIGEYFKLSIKILKDVYFLKLFRENIQETIRAI